MRQAARHFAPGRIFLSLYQFSHIIDYQHVLAHILITIFQFTAPDTKHLPTTLAKNNHLLLPLLMLFDLISHHFKKMFKLGILLQYLGYGLI